MITIREEERTYRQITNIDYCCERLKEAIGDGSLHWTEDQCGIALGAVEGIPISHCPFCGEPFLININRMVTKSEEGLSSTAESIRDTLLKNDLETLEKLHRKYINNKLAESAEEANHRYSFRFNKTKEEED